MPSSHFSHLDDHLAEILLTPQNRTTTNAPSLRPSHSFGRLQFDFCTVQQNQKDTRKSGPDYILGTTQMPPYCSKRIQLPALLIICCFLLILHFLNPASQIPSYIQLVSTALATLVLLLPAALFLRTVYTGMAQAGTFYSTMIRLFILSILHTSVSFGVIYLLGYHEANSEILLDFSHQISIHYELVYLPILVLQLALFSAFLGQSWTLAGQLYVDSLTYKAMMKNLTSSSGRV